MPRLLRVTPLLLALLAGAASASPAAAATSASVVGGVLSVAADDARNVVALGTASGGKVTVADAGALATLASGPGCPLVGGRLECTGVTSVRVELRGGDDALTSSVALVTSVADGDGADVVDLGGGADVLEDGPGADDLDGGAGDDLLRSAASAGDVLRGGTGTDTVDLSAREAPLRVTLDDVAGDGEDGEADDVRADVERVLGGAGDDVLTGSSVANVLRGGAGDDRLDGGTGGDRLEGGAGWDVADFASRRSPVSVSLDDGRNDGQSGESDDVRSDVEEVHGGAGGDRLGGGDARNALLGGDGDDTLDARGGDDVLRGGDGDDALSGHGGVDELDGGPGDDRLWGHDGADRLAAREGDDQLFGAAGDDALDAGPGVDRASGEDGADRLDGGDGRDELSGGAGDDAVSGGEGGGRLDGGDGADVLRGGEQAERFDAGRGADAVDGAGGDDELLGGDDADLLTGGGGADALRGGGGDDALAAGDGDDALHGDDGADQLEAGAGADELQGGGGEDRLRGGDGADRGSGGDGGDLVDAGAGDDRLDGGGGADVVQGFGGDDVLTGSGDADRLEGGDGRDELGGGPGDDVLAGGGGRDALKGDDGEDTVDYGDRRADLRVDNDGAAGDDGGPGEGDTVDRSVDRFIGGAGDDRLSSVNDWPTVIDGGPGDDRLQGSSKDDRLRGADGDDTIVGGPGADGLEGGRGADHLSAADGARDRLSCGSGRDVARMDPADRNRGCERRRIVRPGPVRPAEPPQISPVAGALSGTQVKRGGGRFVRMPGMPWVRVDRRIVADLRWMVAKYRVRITEAYALQGHARHGEHPIGLAADIVPGPGGSWRDVDRLARWAEPRQNRPRRPFRWVGYNGDANHGRGHHLHLSWNHAMPVRRGRPSAWVETLRFSGGRPVRPVGASLRRLARAANRGGPPSVRTGLRAAPRCQGAGQLVPTFKAAARAFGLRWQVLAALTQVESAHGCAMGPSSAGAIGWTQFLRPTWRRWGMDADGDGRASPHNSVDAIFSSARLLRATGAPRSYRRALYAYNHSWAYVRKVLALSRRFGR